MVRDRAALWPAPLLDIGKAQPRRHRRGGDLARLQRQLQLLGRLGRRRQSDAPVAGQSVAQLLDQDRRRHGFRSTFRDWTEEATHYAHEVKEAALAHTVKNKTEAAYRRSDLFEKRREMMDAWAAYATGEAAKVVRIRA
jgi:integrase